MFNHSHACPCPHAARGSGRALSIAVSSLVLLGGCVKAVPPIVAPERPSVEVAAPFEETWISVIDVFASRNIPIQTLDRSSGLIVAAPSGVSGPDADRRASCGAVKHGLDPARKLRATHAEYNIVVRSTSAGSTVRVNVRWTSRNPSDPMRPDYSVCETTNLWEAELERLIRTSAEGAARRPQ